MVSRLRRKRECPQRASSIATPIHPHTASADTRHNPLTHDAEGGTSTPILVARSRHIAERAPPAAAGAELGIGFTPAVSSKQPLKISYWWRQRRPAPIPRSAVHLRQ